MRVAVLVNTAAGSVTGQVDPLRHRLAEAFQDHGIEAELDFFSDGDLESRAGRGLARAKLGQIDAVVVGGGDGSARSVASVLAESGIPLGILPLGTLNHFAKDVRLPLDIEEAVATIAGGHCQMVDMGEVNGELFINNSSIGVYPYMVSDREHGRRAGLAKVIAAAFAFVRMVYRFPQTRLTISAEGWVESLRTPCLFVGNNEYSTGLFTLGTRPTLDAGMLYICVVRRKSALSVLWLAWSLALGLDQERHLTKRTETAVEIQSRRGRLPVALDGEVKMLVPPLRYRTRPGVLKLFAPRPV